MQESRDEAPSKTCGFHFHNVVLLQLCWNQAVFPKPFSYRNSIFQLKIIFLTSTGELC